MHHERVVLQDVPDHGVHKLEHQVGTSRNHSSSGGVEWYFDATILPGHSDFVVINVGMSNCGWPDPSWSVFRGVTINLNLITRSEREKLSG